MNTNDRVTIRIPVEEAGRISSIILKNADKSNKSALDLGFMVAREILYMNNTFRQPDNAFGDAT